MTEITSAQVVRYQDEKGKALSQAQVDALDKKNHGFLSLEIVQEGPPLRVQVRPPSAAELQTLQKLHQQETAALQKKWLDKSLPSFTLGSTSDKLFTNKNLAGHATLLFFWSKADYRSIAQFPALSRLVSSQKGKPVQFWALTFEDAVLIKDFLKQHPFPFTQLPGNFSFVMEDMGIMQTPVYMLLDTKAKIKFISTDTQANIDQVLLPVLAKWNH
ncbi:MAG: TlpA family protein disulfide reductase [Sphingobacteriaceae bacterium]